MVTVEHVYFVYSFQIAVLWVMCLASICSPEGYYNMNNQNAMLYVFILILLSHQQQHWYWKMNAENPREPANHHIVVTKIICDWSNSQMNSKTKFSTNSVWFLNKISKLNLYNFSFLRELLLHKELMPWNVVKNGAAGRSWNCT